MTIITLSTIPSRFSSLGPVLQALVAQEAEVDAVILYIPKRYRRFPDYDGSLPDVPPGVEIRQPDDDLGPASKVLHAVRDFASDPNADILFCDDDLIYRPDWAQQFIQARKERPDNPLCSSGWNLASYDLSSDASEHHPMAIFQKKFPDWDYLLRKAGTQIRLGKFSLQKPEKPWRNRFRRSGFIDVFEGVGGTMVQPRFFDETAFDIPDVLWAVDDVWLSGICVKNGYRPWAVAGASRFTYTEARHVDALNQSVIDGADRYHANRACAQFMKETYGIWGGAGSENMAHDAA